ncbi:MAG TPA: VOC family protein, partial [Candidatus Dormibacteraeota bacterium]|nr:VOC family protein [Candidatus Dormibacteraeota bacterium]
MSLALTTGLDHLVLATPDIQSTVDWVAETLGIRPIPGGQHLGVGTRNFLLGLGSGQYLE